MLSYCHASIDEFDKGRLGPSHVLVLFAVDEMGKFYDLLDQWRSAREGDGSVSPSAFYSHELKIQRMLEYHGKILKSAAFEALKGMAEQVGSPEAKETYRVIASEEFKEFVATLAKNPKDYREGAIYVDYKAGWVNQTAPPKAMLKALIKLVSGDAMSYRLLIDQRGVEYLRAADWLS